MALDAEFEELRSIRQQQQHTAAFFGLKANGMNYK